MRAHAPPVAALRPRGPLKERLRGALGVFRQIGPTLRLVWQADRRTAIPLGLLTVIAAALPPAVAWVGKLIVDAVVAAASGGGPQARAQVMTWVGVEASLLVVQTGVTRLQMLSRELLRARLGNAVNERIMEKALTLEVGHFEDAEVYDKLQNARREASARPLSLVVQVLGLIQNLLTLGTFAAILWRLSPFSIFVIVAASIPAFVAEARLANASFKLNSWRAPEGRRLNYLEWILTRDSHVKEVKLFGLGPLVLGRYRALFRKFFAEDRALAIRRAGWGFGLGLLSLAAFYGAYVYVAGRAAAGTLSLGEMTLYLAVFRQGQAAFGAVLGAVGTLYEDALFMSNLFAFLSLPTSGERPRVSPARTLPRGRPLELELRGVSFRYPKKDAWALREVSLRIRPGEKLALVGENGAGKSTLVKLLMRMYEPTEGQILYGGVDLRDLDAADLRSRIAAVFQDFVRYQFTARENIGLGEVSHLEDRARVEQAAARGGADTVVSALPQGLETPLGGWFEAGQELSAGQWQKIAVSRAFMREAEVLILDEPSASMDAEAEHELFGRFQTLAADRTALVISHRFSTVRRADRIAVFHGGRLVELGSHLELMEKGGRYAHLFTLQAQGYLA